MIQMNGKEFIAKILGGEKDLKGIILPEYYDLTDHEEYGTMQQYLKEHIDERIDLSDSIMIGIVATGIYLPRVIARGANLERANLWKANLEEANLWRAYLEGSNLGEANLWRAYLGEANLEEANLREANLWRAYLGEANLEEANLEEANLLGVKDFKTAKIKNARFGYAIMDPETQEIIVAARRAMKERCL